VDFALGDRRSVVLASRRIGALERAELPGYRLVSGRGWIELATVQAMTMRDPGA
jgi:hypothetical protein